MFSINLKQFNGFGVSPIQIYYIVVRLLDYFARFVQLKIETTVRQVFSIWL